MANWVRLTEVRDSKRNEIAVNLDHAVEIRQGQRNGTLIRFPHYHGDTDQPFREHSVAETMEQVLALACARAPS